MRNFSQARRRIRWLVLGILFKEVLGSRFLNFHRYHLGEHGASLWEFLESDIENLRGRVTPV